jgi:tetratricopeptide (TPR) repeat protein
VKRALRVRRACGALLGIALALICPRAVAALGGPPGDDRVSAPLWREVGHPGQRRARDLLRQALLQEREASRQLPSDWPSLCRRAMSPGFGDDSLAAIRGRTRALRELARQAVVRRARLDSAIVRLQLAAKLAPGDAEILYALARVLIKWEEPGPLWRCSARRRDDEAIAVLEELRRRQPQYAQSAVAFDLAVVLTRASRFADAAQVYSEAIALALDPAESAVMRSNLAEVTMLSGDVESAIVHYERALRAAGGGRDYLLPLWGMAVALDRLGEHDAALEHAGKAVHAEGGRMAVLRSDGVFFEPDHEIHYYEALGHEALAARPDADVARELAAAAASWRTFAAAAGDAGAFAAAARANLERAERELQTERDKRPKRPPRPRP